MLDRRSLLISGVAGIAQIGQHAQPRATPAQILRETHVPALGGVVVAPKIQPIVSVLGRRRANLGAPVQPDDLWLAGAATECMTAALYARLAQTNRAEWRARTPDLFPDLKVHPAWSEVTIEDFLQHRSGVSDAAVATNAFLAAASRDDRPLEVQRTDFAKLILSAPPAADPGVYAFASANYVLVGAAIERAAKAVWEQVVSGELFTPLGMSTAGFGAPTGEEPWGHQVLGARVQPIRPTGIADDPPVFGPAARVHLSLSDYIGFLRIFTAAGSEADPKTGASRAKAKRTDDGGGPEGEGYLTADSLRRIADPRTESGDGPGLGWMVLASRGWAKGPVLSQQSAGGFWACNIAVAPARGVAVAAVSNAGGAAGAAATEREMLTLIQPYAAAG
jgi:CubicO group peptidase (beta-lactamase class C family)